jgi:trk system potassium uptake protein TrkA
MCVRANDLGAKKSVAIIGRPDYARVIDRLGIEAAVSASDVMAKQVMAYLNDGIVISKTKLPGGLIDVVEVDVPEGSPATQGTIAELGLPDRCLIVAVAKQDVVRVPGANDRMQANDTAILLLENDVMEAALAVFTPTNQ